MRAGTAGTGAHTTVNIDGYCRARETWDVATKARQDYIGIWMSTEHVSMGGSAHGDLGNQRANSQVGAEFLTPGSKDIWASPAPLASRSLPRALLRPTGQSRVTLSLR